MVQGCMRISRGLELISGMTDLLFPLQMGFEQASTALSFTQSSLLVGRRMLQTTTPEDTTLWGQRSSTLC